MKIRGLWAENFMSITSVSTDFSNRGLVLIAGDNRDSDAFKSNGSGKSTVFTETLVWALFGETIRGYKGDDVVNKVAKKNTVVVTEIEDDSGDLYRIERYRKHKEHKNHVRVFRNGTNITGKSDKDTNVMIEELIGMDYLSFTNSVMFGQGITKMFASATDSEQKKILERMLQISIFKSCQDKAKSHMAILGEQISGIKSTIQMDENSKATVESNIKQLQDKEAEFEDLVKARIQELQEDKEKYLADLGNLEDPVALEQEAESLKELLGKIKVTLDSYKEYEDSYNELLAEQKSLRRDIQSSERDLSTAENKLKSLLQGKDIPKVCDACGQDLPLDDTTAIENHLRTDIENRKKSIAEVESEELVVLQLMDKVKQKLDGKQKVQDNYDAIKGELVAVQSDIKSIQRERATLEKAIASADSQITEQEGMLGTTFTHLIEENIQKAKDLDEALVQHRKQLVELENDRAKYEFWEDAFSNQGIKSVLLDSVTPFLNARVNKYLAKLAGSSITATFNTQATLKSGEKRDKFSVDLHNEFGDDNYKGNSGGEKRRVDLAVNLTLQDLVASRSNKDIDLIVYDECFDGLDEVGCENVIELLTEKSKEVGTIMVISHNTELKQLFNKTITVRKSGGRTVLEEEVV